eukprot:Skav207117  [mRNA]  locus=scaffold156:241098:241658:- [translate_table: standard]
MTLRCSAAVLLLSLRIVGTAALGTMRSFTVFSEPIFLRRGEVHNRYVLPKALPAEIVQKFAGKTMHMKTAQLDIVLVDNKTGEKQPAPLYMTYNHHHALMLGPQDDLMQLYNYTQGKDPLDPHSFPNQTTHSRHHHGCMHDEAQVLRGNSDGGAARVAPCPHRCLRRRQRRRVPRHQHAPAGALHL